MFFFKTKQLKYRLFLEKFSFWRKTQKFLQNTFFGFCQKFNPFMCLFYQKMVHNYVLYDSAKTACQGKMWFFKMHPTNRIAVSYGHQYFWKESINILEFWLKDNHNGNLVSETTTDVWVELVVSLLQWDCRLLLPWISGKNQVIS